MPLSKEASTHCTRKIRKMAQGHLRNWTSYKVVKSVERLAVEKKETLGASGNVFLDSTALAFRCYYSHGSEV